MSDVVRWHLPLRGFVHGPVSDHHPCRGGRPAPSPRGHVGHAAAQRPAYPEAEAGAGPAAPMSASSSRQLRLAQGGSPGKTSCYCHVGPCQLGRDAHSDESASTLDRLDHRPCHHGGHGSLDRGCLNHQAHASVARRLIVEGFVALCDLVLGALGYRTLRAGVVIGRDKVVVRNLWRSTVVAWDDIDRFAVAGNGPYTTGYVHLRVGTGIATWGIQGQARLLFKNSRWATGPIDTLNTLLAERRARSTA